MIDAVIKYRLIDKLALISESFKPYIEDLIMNPHSNHVIQNYLNNIKVILDADQEQTKLT